MESRTQVKVKDLLSAHKGQDQGQGQSVNLKICEDVLQT